MNILVVNDDGISAKGIKILATALKKYGTVYAVGPDTGRSGAGQSLTLGRELSFEPTNDIDGVYCYKTDGMPVDCVRLAVSVLPVKFDIVFSGCNNGHNLGTDILYSGTCGAAREAQIQGIASVAVSTDWDGFDVVESEIDKVLADIFENKWYGKGYVLNVNFPNARFKASKGYKFAKQGTRVFHTQFAKMPSGKYGNIAEQIEDDVDKDTDVHYACEGYIAITPIKLDQTDFKVLEELKK